MLMFTTQNAVRLALMQVGVIVCGILAAGIGYQAMDELGGTVPVSTVFLVHFGFWLLALPVVWISVAIRFRNNPEISDGLRTATFIAGIGMLLLTGSLALHAGITPWMQGFGPTHTE